MKVTVCFDDVKIIVPCNTNASSTSAASSNATSFFVNKRLSMGKNAIEDFSTTTSNSSLQANSNNNNKSNNSSENSTLKVIDVIEHAIARYKKATAKVSSLT